MAFKSKSFRVTQSSSKSGSTSNAGERLKAAHKTAMEEVVRTARALVKDRRDALDRITDPKLRKNASR